MKEETSEMPEPAEQPDSIEPTIPPLNENPDESVPSNSDSSELLTPPAAQSPAQQAEAHRYGQLGLYCDLLDRAVDLIYLACMALIFSPALSQWLAGVTWLSDWPSGQVAAMFLITFGLHACVSLPLSFYSGHLLEKQFGLSKQTAARWFTRYAKRMLLSITFGLLLFLGLYFMIWNVGSLWWLVAAGAFFLVSIILGQLAPVLIMPLFYQIEPITDESLRERMERLAKGTGLNISGIYRIVLSEETSKANAMLAGLGSTRRVLMGDTVLENFTPEEIDVIFAHEIGHHVHRHITKLMFLGVLLSAGGFWLCDQAMMAYVSAQLPSITYATLPAETVPLLMLLITLFSLFTEPLQNLISRHFERQSDRYALNTTGLREAYLSAFRKLAQLNKDDPHPHPVEVFLFHSHPPISERLAAAEEVPLS